jgi:hypothetical protein
MTFKLQRRNRYPIIFGILGFAVIVASFWVDPLERQSFIFPLLTMIGGVAAFAYSKHSQETELFLQLFKDFNARYDSLNAPLNKIYVRPEGAPLEEEDYDFLYDYFNLCAEEKMFADAGCIDIRVWQSWQNGMRHFAGDPEIREIWESELLQGSYYGFKIPKNK